MFPDEPPYASRLLTAVDTAGPLLVALPKDAVRRAPAPGKWTPVEVIGHLIDSACNNHQRFIRAVDQDALVFAGYAQDEWVERQQYHSAPWTELVLFWQSYNWHLARVMTVTPPHVRDKRYARHNLHQIAFRPLPENEPATLGYLMNDYVDHLEHHLAQILG